jgi:hypothetical protein
VLSDSRRTTGYWLRHGLHPELAGAALGAAIAIALLMTFIGMPTVLEFPFGVLAGMALVAVPSMEVTSPLVFGFVTWRS